MFTHKLRITLIAVITACACAAGTMASAGRAAASPATKLSAMNFQFNLGQGRTLQCEMLSAPDFGAREQSVRCDGIVKHQIDGVDSLLGGNQARVSAAQKRCYANEQRSNFPASSVVGGLTLAQVGGAGVDCVGDAVGGAPFLKETSHGFFWGAST